MFYSKSKKLLLENQRVTIDERFEEDPATKEHVAKYSEKFNSDLNVPCGYADIDLEGRFQYLRI